MESPNNKWIFGVALIFLAVGGYFIFRPSPQEEKDSGQQNQPQSQDTPAISENKPTDTPTSSAPKPASPGSVVGKAVSLKGGIRVLSPAINDSWPIGKTHKVEWTAPSGNVGTAYLADSKTGQRVGYIIGGTTREQTGFSWDTRMVSLTKEGGTSKEVLPGRYVIRVVLGGSYSEISSNPFSIVAEDGVQKTSEVIRVSKTEATPASITIKKGVSVYVVNNGTEKIPVSSILFTASSLAPRDFLEILTDKLEPGYYYIFSSLLPYEPIISVKVI